MNAYLASGLILAAVLNIGYVVLEVRDKRFPELTAIVHIVLASTAIGAGVRVGEITITHDKLDPFSSEDRVYLVLGGVALVVVSCQTIVGVFRRALVKEILDVETGPPRHKQAGEPSTDGHVGLGSRAADVPERS